MYWLFKSRFYIALRLSNFLNISETSKLVDIFQQSHALELTIAATLTVKLQQDGKAYNHRKIDIYQSYNWK